MGLFLEDRYRQSKNNNSDKAEIRKKGKIKRIKKERGGKRERKIESNI